MADVFSTPAGAQAGAQLKAEQSLNGIKAAAVKAGRTLERKAIFESVGVATLEDLRLLPKMIEELKQQHAAHMRAHGKATHRDGLFVGIFLGALLIASAVSGAYWLVKDQVYLNTATQRVNYPLPPELRDPGTESDYQRARNEPGDAP